MMIESFIKALDKYIESTIKFYVFPFASTTFHMWLLTKSEGHLYAHNEMLFYVLTLFVSLIFTIFTLFMLPNLVYDALSIYQLRKKQRQS